MVKTPLTNVLLVGALGAQGMKNTVLGAVIAMAIIIALTTLGGLWAVTMTDCFQILLVIFGVFWVMFAALGVHGGYGNMIAQLEAVSTSLPKDYTTVINGDKKMYVVKGECEISPNTT